MVDRPKGIPRPLVKTNQAFIVLSVLLSWATGYYWILALPLAAGLSSLLLGYNPVMKLASIFFATRQIFLPSRGLGTTAV